MAVAGVVGGDAGEPRANLLARAVDSDSGDAATGGTVASEPSAKPEDGGQDVPTSVSTPAETTTTVAVAKPPAEVSVPVGAGLRGGGDGTGAA